MTTFQRLPHGITLIDTGFQRPYFDASYLIVEKGRAAFVDTGPNGAVPRLLAALAAQGLVPEAVEWVILTHVHLDHAGGAGQLLQHLPRARLVVHPRGARHMVNPMAMLAAVKAVYGELAVERDYGRPVPVNPGRVISVEDGATLLLGERPLVFLDTPGHARHHYCIWDEKSRGFFTGDTLGVAYPELSKGKVPFALPSTSPSQFDPDALRISIGRLLASRPEVAYLTHYGPVRSVAAHAAMVLRQVESMTHLASGLAGVHDGPLRLRQGLVELYLRELAAAGNNAAPSRAAELLRDDVELNAQGLEQWISSRTQVR